MQNLRETAQLLLKRERELFDLRQKHEQLATWLRIGQALADAFLSRGEGNVWDRVRRILIAKLRFQRVLLLELQPEVLRPLTPVASDRPLPVDAHRLLESQPSGWCNDPGAASNAPGVDALAETIGLHRFVWSRVSCEGRPPIIMVGGFDRQKAPFQPPFCDSDAVHLSNAAQHVESLFGNALLVAELEREKDQLRQAYSALEQRDLALENAAAELSVANATLEQRVSDRTLALTNRNRDMRLVLDNIDQALVTVDLDGHLAPERSARFDVWFGSYSGAPRLVEHVKADRGFLDCFELGLEELREGVLPEALCLEQMPKRFAMGGRLFECHYLPIEADEKLTGLLLVIDDITERFTRAQEEASQRELLAAFTALMKDRHGFLAFCAESERILKALATGIDRQTELRLWHTLKGNAACFGLDVVAGLCHRAESELDDDPQVRQQTLGEIRKRWSALAEALETAVPAELRDTVELSEQAMAELVSQARGGASAEQIVEAVAKLRWEPAERPLSRLARHAQRLAERLGKDAPEIDIDTDGIRLDPDRWGPLWSSLVHMVRNAVDHGIEPADERRSMGKASRGHLRLSARRASTGFRLTIGDDGRGIDWESVRRRCVERGHPCGSRSDLIAAITSLGFSVRRDVTEISGRGIGLASVAAVVHELGGELTVDSQNGQGTRWMLEFGQSPGGSVLNGLA